MKPRGTLRYRACMVTSPQSRTLTPGRAVLRPLESRPNSAASGASTREKIARQRAAGRAIPRLEPLTNHPSLTSGASRWFHRRASLPHWIIVVVLVSTILGSLSISMTLARLGQERGELTPASSASTVSVQDLQALVSSGASGQLGQEVDALRDQLQVLAQDLERAQRDSALLRNEARQQESDLAATQAEYAAAEEWRVVSQAELESLSANYQALQDQFKTELSGVQERLASLDQSLQRTEQMTGELRAKVGLPASSSAAGGSGVPDLAEASDPLAAAQSSLAALDDRIATVAADLQTIDKEARAQLAYAQAQAARAQATANAQAQARAQATAQAKANSAAQGSAGNGAIPTGMPVNGPLTSYYGGRMDPFTGTVSQMHTGIDIAVPEGTSVRATGAGTVRLAGWSGGYGNLVILDHGGGISTYYGHNSQLLVSPGQRVGKGDVISRSGTTGYSTGPHVHYEIRRNDVPFDPLPYARR